MSDHAWNMIAIVVAVAWVVWCFARGPWGRGWK